MTNDIFPQPICEQIWNQKYRFKTDRIGFDEDTSVEDTWSRIASSCAKLPRLDNDHNQRMDLEGRFYEALEGFKFLPGGRIQAGAGTGRSVTLFNCFVMGTIPDSLSGIFDMLKEAALTMQQGGGIGYDFSTLRPSGALVKGVESFSSGPLTFMDVWDAMCKTIMSAGSRRGAMMATMRCDHPDILKFITAKQDASRLRNFNVSVLITDDFMYAVRKDLVWTLHFKGKTYGTIKAKDLWEKILRSTYDFAEPGVIFIDRINSENNLHFLEKIAATNPCLHPDSMVETTEGRIRIADMTRSYEVYTMDGEGHLSTSKASASWISKKSAATVKITLDSGKELVCTPDHKIFTTNRGWVEAVNLTICDRVGHLNRTKKSAYYSRVKLNVDPSEKYVPEHRFVADAIYGLPVTDDVHHKDENTFNNDHNNLKVISHSDHSILTNTGADKSSMARDEEGKFTSVITKKTKVSHPMPTELRSNLVNQFSGKVVSVSADESVDVYDITVEDTHNFIANFMVVHNCGEQPLPPYGACLLGSINLAKFVMNPFQSSAKIDLVMLEKTVKTATRMLDSVIDVSGFPLEKQKEEVLNKRRQGLGVTGLADLLFMIGQRYGSPEAVETVEIIMQKIAVWAYEESILMAKDIGSAPCLETIESRKELIQSGFMQRMPHHIHQGILVDGLRNALLLSIAPTGTISMYSGNVSSGIEPIFAPSFTRKITNDDGTKRTEKVLDYAVDLYFKMGFSEKDDWWQNYMTTAQDLDPIDHILMQAAAQEWIDSSISKTVNCPEDITFDDFKMIYEKAYEMGCKGCTTYRPNNVTGSVLTADKPAEETKEEDTLQEPEIQTDMRFMVRPEVMDGSTYKLRWGRDAYYVTFNHVLTDKGWYAPFEIFIMTKNPEHMAWISALTRMISAVFQRGGDIHFVVEEMQSVFDPKGGQWVNGKYVPSLVALIGKTLEEHLMMIGYQSTPEPMPCTQSEVPITDKPEQLPDQTIIPDQCPSCKEFAMLKVSGCPTCQSCGYSKCG